MAGRRKGGTVKSRSGEKAAAESENVPAETAGTPVLDFASAAGTVPIPQAVRKLKGKRQDQKKKKK